MTYKIEISGEDKKALKNYAACLIPVSLGNPNQRGERLRAILDFAETQFPKVTVDLGDLLSRHNYMLPRCVALRQTKEMGDDWERDNRPLLNGSKFVRWGEYLARDGFQEALRESFRLYGKDLAFRSLINQNVETFRERCPEIPPRRARAYLLEEYTVDSRIPEPTIMLYPGKPLAYYAYVPNVRFVQYRLRKVKSHDHGL